MSGFIYSSGRTRPEFFCAAVLALCAAALHIPTMAGEPSTLSLRKPVSTAQAAAEAHPELPTITLKIGGRKVTAEIAADDATRQKGLMFRESLKPDHGMLFVFPRPEQLCFWMKNTPLPLTVAFIDTRGTIVSLSDMQPHTLDPHCAIAPALYALEMEQGWFARHGAGPGASVQGLPRVTQRP